MFRKLSLIASYPGAVLLEADSTAIGLSSTVHARFCALYHRITSHVVSRFSQDQISIPRPTTSILAEFCVKLDSRSTVGGWSLRAAHVFASPRDETRGQPRFQSDFSLSLAFFLSSVFSPPPPLLPSPFPPSLFGRRVNDRRK